MTYVRDKATMGRPGPDEGFTLIEMLIVIVILGILASIVVFAVQNAAAQGAQASCQGDYKTVESAVEFYKAQMGNYPDGSTTGGTGVQTDSDPTAATFNAASASTGAGSELLTPSGGGVNRSKSPQVGPWLKDVPTNSGHFTLSVANNGSGSIAVEDATGNPVGTSMSACSSVS